MVNALWHNIYLLCLHHNVLCHHILHTCIVLREGFNVHKQINYMYKWCALIKKVYFILMLYNELNMQKGIYNNSSEM